MIAGRGLGHTGGTLDKLEAIPGFRTDLSVARFKEIVRKVGCAVMGQTAEIAPLDRRLYAMRDVTGTVSSIPLIAASIMSKKLAEGLTGLLLDVKTGSGAFITDDERAEELACKMVAIGQARGLETVALLTAMDRPLGVAVGHGLETEEAVRCLRGDGPPDLRELVLVEAAEMLRLGDPNVDPTAARARAQSSLDSGRPLERFARLVQAQGGDPAFVEHPERLRTAPVQVDVHADREGVVSEVGPRPHGEALVELGGGRKMMHQPVDPGVGFEVRIRPGDRVSKGDPVGTVHAAEEAGAGRAAAALLAAVRIGGAGGPVVARPLVGARFEGSLARASQSL
jgi:pyrimidine-nucleoside phosphorylase